MKKIFIAAAIVLGIGTTLTAVSLTHKADKQVTPTIKIEASAFSTKAANAPKSDLGSAD